MFDDDLYRMVVGFHYPRSYDKIFDPPYKGGDARLNDFHIVKPK